VGFYATSPCQAKGDPTPKNRVWRFFRVCSGSHPGNRLQPPQLRREIAPTATRIASGLSCWPSRDPIGERGGVNLYGFLRNNSVSLIDVKGTDAAEGDASTVTGNAKIACEVVIARVQDQVSLPSLKNPYGPTGAVTNITNTGGCQLLGFGYTLAINDAAEDANEDANEIAGDLVAYLLCCKRIGDLVPAAPDPEPEPPSPTPEPVRSWARCLYKCPLLRETEGTNPCVYGNCILDREIDSFDGGTCRDPWVKIYRQRRWTDKKGCEHCKDPLEVEEWFNN